MDARQIGLIAAKAAAEKKAQGILVQDVRGLSDICSYQLICSGMNEKQTQAICQNIENFIKQEAKIKPVAIEGKKSATWILMDYHHLIVHVFTQTTRMHYGLEQLWKDAKQVELRW